jgi:hypothetical protein
MRAKRWAIAFVLISMFVAIPAFPATLTWTAPTLYTDNTAIPAAKIATITYTPAYGSSASGPWTAGTATAAGATSAVVPDPASGTTRYYTVQATLDGQTSGYATPPVSKTAPFLTPKSPTGLSVN